MHKAVSVFVGIVTVIPKYISTVLEYCDLAYSGLTDGLE